jgi:hypothetical protein
MTCSKFGDCADPTLSIVHHENSGRPELAESNVVYTHAP